ncbi:MAG: PleD family two-component system response regulator [Elusimicrobiales bacterium]
MKVLVIEDNESFSLVLCAALREAGHEVDAALSGKEGVKAALVCRPDLVLLDYELGDMTGYDVVLGLKCMRATAATPFILLSSLADDPLMTGAFKKLPNCRGTMIKNQPMADILVAVATALP